MAETKKIVYLDLLNRYDTKIKAHIADKIDELPSEQFLQQAGTKFEPSFAWSEETYPGSTNPSLDGEPVLVLALSTKTRNEEDPSVFDEGVTYSFLNMKTLVDIYTAGDDTSTVAVTIDSVTNKITAEVKVSAEENNIIEIRDDGIYADTTDKANLLLEDEIQEGQVLIDNGKGDLGSSKVFIGGESIQVKVGEYESVSINDTSLAGAWSDGSFEFTDDAEWEQNSETAMFRSDVLATEEAVMKSVPLIVKSVGFEKQAGGFTASTTADATTLITRTNDANGEATGYSSTAYIVGADTVNGNTQTSTDDETGEEVTTTTYSETTLATEAAVMAEIKKVNELINNVSASLDYATEDDIASMFA